MVGPVLYSLLVAAVLSPQYFVPAETHFLLADLLAVFVGLVGLRPLLALQVELAQDSLFRVLPAGERLPYGRYDLIVAAASFL